MRPASPIPDRSRDSRIDHAGRISRTSFEVVLGLFCGIAVITVIMRLALRVFTRRKLNLSDYLVFFGLACLGAATGLIYSFTRMIFLSNAVRLDPSVSPTFGEIAQLTDSLKIIYSFLALIWTTTFAVKLSFLVFFKKLIDRVSRKITIYYWFLVVFTMVSWMFVVSEPFVLCPYFGLQTVKCLPESPFVLTLALTTFITILDIATDIMIVSIPIIVLRKSQIRLKQKIVLGVFFCLSLVMVIAALTRISAYRLRGVIDLTWQIFWQYMEGSIALIMASVTTFRTAFVAAGSKRNEKPEQGPSYSVRQRLLARRNRIRSDELEKSRDQEGLPAIPGATLAGLRTFIRRNHRPTDEVTVMHSEFDRSDEEHCIRPESSSDVETQSEATSQSHKKSSSLEYPPIRNSSLI